jgi:hypothetical protein
MYERTPSGCQNDYVWPEVQVRPGLPTGDLTLPVRECGARIWVRGEPLDGINGAMHGIEQACVSRCSVERCGLPVTAVLGVRSEEFETEAALRSSKK